MKKFILISISSLLFSLLSFADDLSSLEGKWVATQYVCYSQEENFTAITNMDTYNSMLLYSDNIFKMEHVTGMCAYQGSSTYTVDNHVLNIGEISKELIVGSPFYCEKNSTSFPMFYGFILQGNMLYIKGSTNEALNQKCPDGSVFLAYIRINSEL